MQLEANTRKYTFLHTFVIITKCGQKYEFAHLRHRKPNSAKIANCMRLLSLANELKDTPLHAFTTIVNSQQVTSLTRV